MDKKIFTIVTNEKVACGTFRMELECPGVGKMKPGQFVDIALEGKFLRRPISVCDSSEGRLTLIYKVVGEGTSQMSDMRTGAGLELLTGLGNGYDLSECHDAALLVGGGLGAAPLYFLSKELLALGRKVSVVLGFNTKDETILADGFRALGVNLLIATMDGSEGVKGFVTDAIERETLEYDYFYCCGPMPMIRALCTTLDSPGEASLEQRMGCGAGFCYGCSFQTAKGPKRICKDGPVFKKEDILW